MAEVGGNDKEFDAEIDDDNENIFNDLTPIEQYALTFVQRENQARQATFEREYLQKEEGRKQRETERKMRGTEKREMQMDRRSIIKRSERIDSKQKMEKAKENEKKRQRDETSLDDSVPDSENDEEVYIPRKRGVCKNNVTLSPRGINGTRDKKGRGRPRKEDQMKVRFHR